MYSFINSANMTSLVSNYILDIMEIGKEINVDMLPRVSPFPLTCTCVGISFYPFSFLFCLTTRKS